MSSVTPASSWALVDRWEAESGLPGVINALKRLTVMPLFAVSGLALVVDWPWWCWLALLPAVLLGAYLLISTLIYLAMISGGGPGQPVEVPLAEGSRFLDAAREFGVGIGIEPNAWHLINDALSTSAVASMPDVGSHSLVVIGGEENDGSIQFSLVGRQATGRLVVSGFVRPMFPFEDADWFFDAEASAHMLWRSHCELIDQDAEVTFQDYFARLPTENIAKQAGLWRTLRTWGRTSWQKRGIVRGYQAMGA